MDCKREAAEHTWIEVLDPEPGEPQFALCLGCGVVGMVVSSATAEVQVLAA
jgi:hypothetical protein